MLQLVKFGIDWKCGELEQTVNIPVTQIVEEITEVNIPVTQIVEEIADREYSYYTDWKRSQIVNIPVTQIVEEITDREYSSSTECGRDCRGEQILE